jgi:hypothetical protein
MYGAMISSRFGDWYNTILHIIHALVAHNTLNESSNNSEMPKHPET